MPQGLRGSVAGRQSEALSRCTSRTKEYHSANGIHGEAMLSHRSFVPLLLAGLISAAPIASQAKQLRPYGWGQWSGGSYTDDATQQFSYCSAGVPYRSGIYMMVSISRGFGWGLGFFNQAWNLTQGQNIPVALNFDGGPLWNETARVLNQHLAVVPMEAN